MEDQIYFGGFYLPAPESNQSINLFYYMDQGWSQEGYYLDNSPTFGFENDTINANGNIEGFVKDSLDTPIEGVKVIYGYEDMYPGLPIYVVTNSEGYFNLRGLSTFKRLEFEKAGFYAPDTTVFIYPDSTIQINIKMQTVIGVTESPEPHALSYELKQNFPNPFNSSTTFYYVLGDEGYVEINIYDEKGELVENLFKGNQYKGEYKINWNADNLSSGIYFYELKTKDIKLSKKCLLLK